MSSTTILSVRCQNCGASLQLNEQVRFITCHYCKGELEVVQNESATYTKLLDQLVSGNEEMKSKLEVIQLQNDLNLLEQDWQRWKEEHLDQDEHGLVEPTDLNSGLNLRVGLTVFFVGLVTSTIVALVTGKEVAGILIIFTIVGGIISLRNLYGEKDLAIYQNNHTSYLTKRAILQGYLEKARKRQ